MANSINYNPPAIDRLLVAAFIFWVVGSGPACRPTRMLVDPIRFYSFLTLTYTGFTLWTNLTSQRQVETLLSISCTPPELHSEQKKEKVHHKDEQIC